MLSHELRTPLTPVLMATETLLRRKDLPPLAIDALEMILRNVEIEAHFIDDLLDLTRISRGKLEISREALDLHQAIKRAVEISQPDFLIKNQNLTLNLDAKPSLLLGDSLRLQQVFWNLLKNASKFTPEGGSIEITSHTEPEWLVVQVSDNGMGIDPSALPTLFEAFRQEDLAISRQFGGLGLGLAISKATVEALGGTIAATSGGRDQGTTVTVKLPLQARAQTATQ
jgi:two-component system CheB/CheR fusion protein